MIEDLMKHLKTTFTIDEELVDQSFRSPFFEDLEKINTVFEIKEHKRQVTITRPYQCGIAIYQLAKLCMLDFYYDFLDKYLDRHNFELIQMDTDSMYMAISGTSINVIVGLYEKDTTMVEKPSFCRLQSIMTKLQDYLKSNFRTQE